MAANDTAISPADWTEGEEFLKKADERFAPLMKKYGHCTLAPLSPEKYFAALMGIVLSQNTAADTALNLSKAAMRKFGDAVQAEDILAAGIRGLIAKDVALLKAGYVLNAAQAAAEGRLALEKFPAMGDKEIAKQMEAITGLGRWTAEQFLIAALARPDVFPGKDQFLQLALREFYGLKEKPKNRLEENALTNPWRPWRSVAVWYLWRTRGEKKEGGRIVPGPSKPRPKAKAWWAGRQNN
jgi:DNA-3-methyladenine glycosylase II